jgi:hypothetical protein
MKYRVVAIAFLATLHSAAWAGPEAKVRGWARGQNPRTVEVFDAEGAPRGFKDLSGVDVAGRRPWDPATGLVQLPGSQWVESKRLDLVFCETANVSFNPQAKSRPAGAKTYGSGGPCDVK